MSHRLATLLFVLNLLVVGCGEQARLAPLDAGTELVAPDGGGRDFGPNPCPGRTDPDEFGPCDAGVDEPIDRPDGDAGVVRIPDAGPTGPGACPFPEGPECPTRCLLEARSEDPCGDDVPRAGGVILEDTTLSGRFCIDRALGVANGATLTLTAGAELYFQVGSLTVEGHLAIEGTAERPVLLSADGREPRVGDWGGVEVRLHEGGTADIAHAVIEFGQYGVATWEAASRPTRVGDPTRVGIRGSLLRYNFTGAVPDDNTEVSANTFFCNDKGISVASEDEPIQGIHGNNLCDNTRWDVVAHQDGADLNDNHWCTPSLDEVFLRTFDERDDLSLGGLLLIERLLDAPAAGAPPIR